MNKSSEIKSVIKSIAGTDNSKGLFFVATVVSLDDQTCTVDFNNLELSDVRIGAIVDGNENNLLIKPKVGSSVLLADLSDGLLRDLKVIACSEIDSITVNGGKLGGLCNVIELKSQLEKLSKRVDDIIDAINNGVPGSSDGGAALQTTIKTSLGLITEKEDFANIEDETIKH